MYIQKDVESKSLSKLKKQMTFASVSYTKASLAYIAYI